MQTAIQFTIVNGLTDEALGGQNTHRDTTTFRLIVLPNMSVSANVLRRVPAAMDTSEEVLIREDYLITSGLITSITDLLRPFGAADVA